MTTCDALFTPAEFAAFQHAGTGGKVCVVFDILRATTTMTVALARGAREIQPAATIAEALQSRAAHPACLLAGERDGLRIRADRTGGIDFDLGNSPREFLAAEVRGKSIVMTTTNGTRALRACAGADRTLVCSFLNLTATAEYLARLAPPDLVLVGSGTGEHAAYEDVLGIGALAEALGDRLAGAQTADSVRIARRLYQTDGADLAAALARGNNGQRLLTLPELRADVAFCARRDEFPIVAGITGHSSVKLITT